MEDLEGKQGSSAWQRWRASLNNRYRMSVMNEDTFEEVRSFQLSLMNVYLALSSIVVLVALIVVVLIAFTPLKKYLPGFGDVVAREELMELSSEITSLERELEAQTAYADNFRNLLLGKYQSVLESQQGIDSAALENLDNIEEVTISAEEMQLRREMELESVGAAARNARQQPISGSRDIPLEQLFFVAPIRGEIIGGFELDENHNGVDIIAAKGTAVKAAMDGFVILSDYTYDTGYTIGIQHQNGVISFYKHNQELLKEVGSFVKGGEAIAIIGNTGHQTTGPHLHFELWWHGIPVDPVDYIRF
ncbi:MAG: M23 family metallopeptidase [Lewinella sp.]|jgi:murein DD-endopeptidase MepM/ murein hydrolase activator NlpD|uniref:M23 family metallopeptidase n=1 Tax=Lewinella sp. TaxID=2004506 RepID=UPI003D6A130F